MNSEFIIIIIMDFVFMIVFLVMVSGSLNENFSRYCVINSLFGLILCLIALPWESRHTFNLRSVGPYDSYFDHQQIDNHRVWHLVPEIADQIT
jgi:hypothetical protein